MPALWGWVGAPGRAGGVLGGYVFDIWDGMSQIEAGPDTSFDLATKRNGCYRTLEAVDTEKGDKVTCHQNWKIG